MADRAKFEYSTKAKIGPFRASFLKILDKPDINKDDNGNETKTWGLVAIFETDAEQAPLKAAFKEAAKKMWGDKAETTASHKNFLSPFKTGDDMRDREGKLYAGFTEDCFAVKLNSKQGSPQVVDKQLRLIVDYDGKTLVDPEKKIFEEIEENRLWSGCWFKASFTAQAYDHPKNFGISFKLENLQLIKQDKKLGGGGRTRASDDFEAVDAVGASKSASADDMWD